MDAVLGAIAVLAMGDYVNAQPYRQWRREPAPYDADDDPWNQPPDPNPQGNPEQTHPQGAHANYMMPQPLAPGAQPLHPGAHQQPPPPLLQHPEAVMPGGGVEYTQQPAHPFPLAPATGTPQHPQGAPHPSSRECRSKDGEFGLNSSPSWPRSRARTPQTPRG